MEKLEIVRYCSVDEYVFILFQTGRMLDEEEREDTELRDRFKENWKRQPSDKLTESLRKEVYSCVYIVTSYYIHVALPCFVST